MQRLDGGVHLHAADDLCAAGAPVHQVHVAAATRHGEDVARRIEGTLLQALLRVLLFRRRVGGREGRAPEASRGACGCARLEVESVEERTRPCEEDGSAVRVEGCVRKREGWDVHGLDVRVGVSVDLVMVSELCPCKCKKRRRDVR